jgi:hypothetical protein
MRPPTLQSLRLFRYPPDRGWFCWSTDYTDYADYADYEKEAHLNLCNLRNLWTVRIDHAIMQSCNPKVSVVPQARRESRRVLCGMGYTKPMN